MDTFLRIVYEIVRGILVFISAVLHFTCLILCTLLFALRKLREACDDFFNFEQQEVIHDRKRA